METVIENAKLFLFLLMLVLIINFGKFSFETAWKTYCKERSFPCPPRDFFEWLPRNIKKVVNYYQ